MGRFLTHVAAQPRRKRVILTASNTALEVPPWARNGKGIMLVSGVGGGGAAADTSTWGGGGAGAHAIDMPIPIPSGLASVGVTIAAGGVKVAASAGTNGGDTTLSIAGNAVLRLGGGDGGAADIQLGGKGGVPSLYTVAMEAGHGTISNSAPTVKDLAYVRQAAINVRIPCVSTGLAGYRGNPTNGSLPDDVVGSLGGPSPFGGYQASGWGYGYGGGQRGGPGGNGLLIIEFVEGA